MTQELDDGRVQFGSPRESAPTGASMTTCEVCGNDYAMAFQVIAAGQTHTFDSFECAIHRLAPRCEHCGCTILGHGIEGGGRFFCCASCARHAGVSGAVDNA